MIPPGTRGMPHFHAEHESAIYTVSGETEVWHGDGLVQRTIVRAGDFMYVPPGTRTSRSTGDGSCPSQLWPGPILTSRKSVVILELPRHLSDLLSLPVAIQE